LTESLDDKRTFAYDYTIEVWDYRDTSNTFFSIVMGTGHNRFTYFIIYLKIKIVLATIGGIMECLLLFGRIFMFYFAKLQYKEFLVHLFFDKKNRYQTK
jgi:hypothetical protein